MLKDKTIVITRSVTDSNVFASELKLLGADVYLLPTIEIQKKELDHRGLQTFKELSSYDLIVFTSSHAVDFFCQNFTELRLDKKIFEKSTVAAVGPATAEFAEKSGINVKIIPENFTAAELAKKLKEFFIKDQPAAIIKNGLVESGKTRRIVIFCSAISDPALEKSLQEYSATVNVVHLYSTEEITEPDPEFSALLRQEKINYLTFASPSSVSGFSKRVKDDMLFKRVLILPAVCIGPRTATAARELGFTNIVQAEPHTTKGMIKALLSLN